MTSNPVTILVMGVSGSGKTTIGLALSEMLSVEFFDADDFHLPESIAKMTKGIPLTDDDRQPWLDRISTLLRDRNDAGLSSIVACSALKRRYRDRLLASLPGTRLIYLNADRELLATRLAERTDHFMPPALLDSQYAALEEPAEDENAIVADCRDKPNKTAFAIAHRLTGGFSSTWR